MRAQVWFGWKMAPQRLPTLSPQVCVGALFGEAVDPVGAGALLKKVCHSGIGGGLIASPHFPVRTRRTLSASACGHLLPYLPRPFWTLRLEPQEKIKSFFFVLQAAFCHGVTHRLLLIILPKWDELRGIPQRWRTLVPGASKCCFLRKGHLCSQRLHHEI